MESETVKPLLFRIIILSTTVSIVYLLKIYFITSVAHAWLPFTQHVANSVSAAAAAATNFDNYNNNDNKIISNFHVGFARGFTKKELAACRELLEPCAKEGNQMIAWF